MRLAFSLLLVAALAACSNVPSLPDLPGLPGDGAPSGSLPGGGGTPPGSGNADSDSPGEGVWDGYDFVSGSRVLYYNDFEDTPTGDYPQRTEFIGGNAEVVEIGGTKAVRTEVRGCFTIPLPETLPERYTIEFRVRHNDLNQNRASFYLFSGTSDDTPDTRCTYPPNPHVFVHKNAQGLQLPGGYGAATSEESVGIPANRWIDVRLAADRGAWKMYVNDRRVGNVPDLGFPASNELHLFFGSYGESEAYVDEVRVAAGGPSTTPGDFGSDGLIETTAIRFDTASDRLRPESTGVLDQMVGVIQSTDGTIQIEGHTDSAGSDATNQDLSERRAMAVKRYLTRNGIAESRLTTVGYGESRPVADNSTAEGMAQNRRVGFRRM